MIATWSDTTEEMRPFVDGARVLRFEIRANAFCHQMVRAIVGTHIDIGRGRFHAGDIRTMMRSRNRKVAGDVAPAHGLMLWEVGFDGPRYDASTTRLRSSET